MKNALLVAACAVGFLTACATSPDKTEPANTEPAASQPAPAAEPVKTEPVPAEPAPSEPAKAEPPKREPAKPAAKNEPKPAVPKETTLSSGLRIIDSKEGQGDAVATGNLIQVHYTGWLYENGVRGSKFDSSLDRGQPFEFTVGSGVIRGWSEGVVGMKPGGKRELIIPSALGYGPRGAGGGVIPPNATLDFEIEMLKILR